VFSGLDFAGQHVSLANYRGRYVYVNFFASWCPPCQSEEPNLLTFAFQQSRLGAAGAGLVSVVFDDSTSAAKRYAQQAGQTWPTVPDQSGSIANDYGVGSPPMTFLVNPEGTVVGVWEGPVQTSQLNSMLATAKSST
jgi:thiol-disulfide isomerase/thioredoxin